MTTIQCGMYTSYMSFEGYTSEEIAAAIFDLATNGQSALNHKRYDLASNYFADIKEMSEEMTESVQELNFN